MEIAENAHASLDIKDGGSKLRATVSLFIQVINNLQTCPVTFLKGDIAYWSYGNDLIHPVEISSICPLRRPSSFTRASS